MAKTGVGYKGVVTIQFRKGKKKPYKTIVVKNTGTDKFFEILCNAAIGSSMNAYMPQFLGVFSATGETETSAASVRIHWESATVGNDSDGYFAQFDFILPGSYISGAIVNRLKMYNSLTTTDPLAVLDTGTDIAVSTDSNLYITWKMYFGNQTEITNNSSSTVHTTPAVNPGTTS